MSNPIEELGKVMSSQMKQVFNANQGITIELGIITSGMGLTVGSLGNTIPKGDYMISMHLMNVKLTLDTTEVALETEEEDEHTHTIEKHKHQVTLPNKLRGLQEGDRVIVAWIGTEPVVVDIVVSS